MEQGQAQGHSSTWIILGEPSPLHPQALPWLGGLPGGAPQSPEAHQHHLAASPPPWEPRG